MELREERYATVVAALPVTFSLVEMANKDILKFLRDSISTPDFFKPLIDFDG